MNLWSTLTCVPLSGLTNKSDMVGPSSDLALTPLMQSAMAQIPDDFLLGCGVSDVFIKYKQGPSPMQPWTTSLSEGALRSPAAAYTDAVT